MPVTSSARQNYLSKRTRRASSRRGAWGYMRSQWPMRPVGNAAVTARPTCL